MTAPSGRSPYFDFQSQAKSPDIGFAASEGEAFAFAPLPRRFLKFRFYECASHFFVFGSDSASKFSLLEILRDEGQIEEQSVVTVPALADDIRFASCKGTAVEQVAPGRWRVQMTLKNGGLETIETSNLIFEGVVKWSVQELEGVEAYTACLKELEERFRANAWLEHEHFDGIVGLARFTDQWCALPLVVCELTNAAAKTDAPVAQVLDWCVQERGSCARVLLRRVQDRDHFYDTIQRQQSDFADGAGATRAPPLPPSALSEPRYHFHRDISRCSRTFSTKAEGVCAF